MTNDYVDQWLWNGIEYRYSKCCIFFFIYCRSIYNPSYEEIESEVKCHEWSVEDPNDQIIDKKLQEEQDEKERKEWDEGGISCWILEQDGPIRCPDCILKELKRRKMTNTLDQFSSACSSSGTLFRDIQPRFLKEQK